MCVFFFALSSLLIDLLYDGCTQFTSGIRYFVYLFVKCVNSLRSYYTNIFICNSHLATIWCGIFVDIVVGGRLNDNVWQVNVSCMLNSFHSSVQKLTFEYVPLNAYFSVQFAFSVMIIFFTFIYLFSK